MKIPVRVEASRGGVTGYLELEDRYVQLLREWVELQDMSWWRRYERTNYYRNSYAGNQAFGQA